MAYLTYTAVSVDFNKFFTALTFVGVILVLFFGNKNNPIKFPKYLFFYFLFVLYIYYSQFIMLERKFKLIYLVHDFVGAFNFLFIIENLPINKKYYKTIFELSKKILLIAVIVILIQQVYSLTFFARTDTIKAVVTGTEDRLYSIYTWTSGYGVGLSFVPIFLLVVEVLNKKGKNTAVLLWVLTGIIFAILTRFRWVIVNTLLVFFVIIITEKNKINKIARYIVVLPLILFASYTLLDSAGIDVKGIVEDRLLEKGKSKSDTSATTRILAFKVFGRLYWKNAVFGVGDMKYGMASGKKGHHNYELSKALGGRSSQIHVGYLSLFYLYGMIGGICFFLFLFYLMKRLFRNAKKTSLWAPFFGILCFILANFTLVAYSVLELGLIFSILSSKYSLEIHNKKQIFFNKK